MGWLSRPNTVSYQTLNWPEYNTAFTLDGVLVLKNMNPTDFTLDRYGSLPIGRAAIDDLTFQRLSVERALAQDRVRVIIADDVGIGKALEAGLITSAFMLRGRADRILAITT